MQGRVVGALAEWALDAAGGLVAAPSDVGLVAHRGFASVRPENTVGAVEAAGRRADAVEVDVRRCASGEVVACHDETVDRVTDATGAVAAFDASVLADLSVLGSDDGVPTLDAVLDAVPADVAVNVECKERGLGADVERAAARVENDVLVSSSDPIALDEVALPRALVFAERPTRNLERAADLDCTAVHPSAALALGTSVVADARERGFDVRAWTVDSPAVARALAARGVDGVIADRPSVVQRHD